MKKSRFTDSQIMSILKQAEAETSVAELCLRTTPEPPGMAATAQVKWGNCAGLKSRTPGSRI